MKTRSINVIAVFVLLLLFATGVFAQTKNMKAKDSNKKIAKVDKTKIPKEVTDVWMVDYPGATYVDWYGYPMYSDYLNDWYYDWYDNDYDPYLMTEYPDYYVAEFTEGTKPAKAVYSKAGKKMAIHKKLASDLPMAVSSALATSAYKGWTVGKDKEEIFKDTDMDQLKVYRVYVEKGNEKHALYFQNDGKLLKDKKIKM